MFQTKEKKILESIEDRKTRKLLSDDLVQIPIDYLFDSDKKKFDVLITDQDLKPIKLNDTEIGLIRANLNKDCIVTCKIRSIAADGSASLKISIADKFLYARVNVKKDVEVTGIEIFRYVTSSSIPNLSENTLDSLVKNPNSLAAKLYAKVKKKHEWLEWNLSSTSEHVVQLLRTHEKFSSFSQEIYANAQTEQSKLVIARRSFLMCSENSSNKLLDTWTSSSVIKEKVTVAIKTELENTDVIPNLFEDAMPPQIDKLLKVYNLVGTEAEIKREIIYVYEIILQLIFPQRHSIIGTLIAAWNKDKDIIVNLDYKKAFMDLLSVLNMICVDKNFVEGNFRKDYPKLIAAADVVVEKFLSQNSSRQRSGSFASIHTSGESDFHEDAQTYARRFAKLSKNAPKVNRAVLYS